MRCKKQYRNSKIQINNLIEVVLDLKTWVRIQKCAYKKKCSYSWITRYCVFKLIRRQYHISKIDMEKHSLHLKKGKNKIHPKHRHIMCLYGEDEKLLKLTVLHYGITISQLIRIALHRFLGQIESNKIPWNHIFYYGTKICRYFDLAQKSILQLPYTHHIFFAKWPYESWWRRPNPDLPVPYTP